MVRFIDLFAGLGGFRIAFEQEGGECVFSSEIDEAAREVYKQNFGEEPHGDITKISPKSIPDHDVLCAGFPCQPFSLAGARKGFLDTRGTLFFEIEKILKEKQPKAFILENVAGIVSHDGGKTLKVILEKLREAGYSVEWKNLNSKDYGLPQNRNRWYCVGFLKKKNIKFNDLNKNKFVERAFNFPEKRDLLFTLNDIVSDNLEKTDIYKITDTAKKNIAKHLNSFKGNKRYNENEILIANEIRPSRCHFRSDGISPCLTAKMGTGGNNIPVYVQGNRKLTEEECLKIMGFPTNYKIKKNSYQSYKQIGNSVVVPVINLLAKEINRLIV